MLKRLIVTSLHVYWWQAPSAQISSHLKPSITSFVVPTAFRETSTTFATTRSSRVTPRAIQPSAARSLKTWPTRLTCCRASNDACRQARNARNGHESLLQPDAPSCGTREKPRVTRIKKYFVLGPLFFAKPRTKNKAQNTKHQ